MLQPDGKTPQVVTFRKILLNKCQKEFEKENTDEKNLEEDRNKTFETVKIYLLLLKRFP